VASGCLVTVVSGVAYERFSDDLFRSAEEFFHPLEEVEHLMLQGATGWPHATMLRYHALLQAPELLSFNYIWMVDADMRFEETVGREVLGRIVAVRHPGYVHSPISELPYERRPHSACAIAKRVGSTYYAGGFVGGETGYVFALADRIAGMIDHDMNQGIVPRWHDESALNRCLADDPPEVALSPAFCHPENDEWYLTVWPEPYPRKLVALDKTVGERGHR